jgi:hypothetical protein
MSAILNLKYFNSFWLKKIDSMANNQPSNPRSNLENVPGGYASSDARDWYVEEARIRGGYNNNSIDFGVKAYLVEDQPTQQHRFNSIIYSGVFNSRTGVNSTNVFSVGDDITKSADPANGSIQKLFAENTDLIILQEDKVSRALIDKDAIYSAEGGAITTSASQVIGQMVPYLGNYGITTDPESFAVYGYRKYFTDRKRNVVLRLSRDGITEISSYGMSDFFRDKISSLSSSSKIIGGWDMHSKNYVLSIQQDDGSYDTLSFDEDVKGWTSFFSYKPDFILSLNSSLYSSHNGELWKHYSFDESSSVNRGIFYGQQYKSSVQFVFNNKQSLVKNFKTINYEGSGDWRVDLIATTIDVGLSIDRAAGPSSRNTLLKLEAQLWNNNFKRKENKYFANIVNSTPVEPGDIVFGNGGVSGVKGFFAVVNMSVDNSLGGKKELFAVSTDYTESSY